MVEGIKSNVNLLVEKSQRKKK